MRIVACDGSVIGTAVAAWQPEGGVTVELGADDAKALEGQLLAGLRERIGDGLELGRDVLHSGAAGTLTLDTVELLPGQRWPRVKGRGHVEAGSRWFRYLCRERGLDPEATYFKLIDDYLGGEIRCPLHREARLRAGFSEHELTRLEELCNRS